MRFPDSETPFGLFGLDGSEDRGLSSLTASSILTPPLSLPLVKFRSECRVDLRFSGDKVLTTLRVCCAILDVRIFLSNILPDYSPESAQTFCRSDFSTVDRTSDSWFKGRRTSYSALLLTKLDGGSRSNSRPPNGCRDVSSRSIVATPPLARLGSWTITAAFLQSGRCSVSVDPKEQWHSC